MTTTLSDRRPVRRRSQVLPDKVQGHRPHLDDVERSGKHCSVVDCESQLRVQEVRDWHEVVPPKAGVVTALAVSGKAAVAVAEAVLATSQLVQHRHTEEQPARALVGPRAIRVLALQAAPKEAILYKMQGCCQVR